ncbi:hypothetical protein LIER_24158 [Lithospermum erythrorhizon]|uniref:Uncharacterized protein n=1 Tax=Lithospermum erythrorhizon TaxID=34254 RepID=A0AAV3R1B7_LITER
MAIPSARLIQDQNLDIRFTGREIIGDKTDGSKAQKKGGFGSRKALNDISNSAKPTPFQVSKKHNSKNVIAIDRDTGAASKTPFTVGGKQNASKAPQKGQSGGRKALSDLTNSGKPSLQKVAKKSQDKKLSAITEKIDIEEEGFLHDHQECIKAQKTIMDKDCFLKLIGLDDAPPFLPPASESRPRSPTKLLEMEEIPVSLLDEDQFLKGGRSDYPGFSTPACLSPVSPRLSSAHWNSLMVMDEKFVDFRIIESPKHSKSQGLRI